ncbi:MAG: EscU/YscU/HrcU family type III secretion system export apparatus switch protein [Dethiobacter sp.]|jgi:flagellar biosynthesis protein|nr:EscU/YscU/HrcU family type III secretion system export apparatus switch protein [Dethiobacter sp.]MBS3990041.1 EscU/YscU/HrcU family type III secretion system export apparatus switch protein [Dethiobacter sp.]
MKERKKAIALRYQQDRDQAPRVVAAGAGYLAEKILEIAHKNGISVREDSVLAEALSLLEPGSEIPEELYLAVAQILVEIINADRKQKK